jgi:hypothetical protein
VKFISYIQNKLVYIQEVTGSNVARDTDYPEVSHDLPRSMQVNAGIVPHASHDCILSKFYIYI